MIKQYRWFPNALYTGLSNVNHLEYFRTGRAFEDIYGTVVQQIAIQAPAGTEIILSSNPSATNVDFSQTTNKIIVGSTNLFTVDFRNMELEFGLGLLAINAVEELEYPNGIIVDIVTRNREEV